MRIRMRYANLRISHGEFVQFHDLQIRFVIFVDTCYLYVYLMKIKLTSIQKLT